MHRVASLRDSVRPHGVRLGGVVTVDKIKVGQLWRRRADGKAFIPAVKVADGWLNKAGNKRTAKQLQEKYVRIDLDDDTTSKKKPKKKRT